MEDNEIIINLLDKYGGGYSYDIEKNGGGYSGKTIFEVPKHLKETLEQLKVKERGLTVILKSEVKDSRYERNLKVNDLNIIKDKLSESFNETKINLELYESNFKNQ